MDPRVLNLTAFGDVLKNPKDSKNDEPDTEPQRALPPPVSLPAPEEEDDFRYVDSPEKSMDFRTVIAQKKPSDSNGSKYGKVTKMVLQNMSQTKLLHWQCMLYGQHKALDGLFDSIIEIGDTLIETLMGKYGRPVLTGDDLNIKLYNFEDAKNGDLSKFMEDIYKCYREDCRSYFSEENDTEILNIIDEMIGAIDQTKYLISLR